MPPKEKDKPDELPFTPTESDAAVVEIVDPKKSITVPYKGVDYSFKRKRTDSVQWRMYWQKGQDAVAIEWLLGPFQFARFLDANGDEDGTDMAVFADFAEALGEALGAGNS